jgi:hypothetical protein
MTMGEKSGQTNTFSDLTEQPELEKKKTICRDLFVIRLTIIC